MPRPNLPSTSWTQFQPILDAAREGNDAALQKLFEHFYPRVRRMVHRSLETDLRTNRPWIAALFSTGDVVQEVFQSALRDLEKVESATEESFAGYLAMLVRNRLIDAIRFHEAARRDGRRVAGSPDFLEKASSASGPPTQARSAEELGMFRQALSSFCSRERNLLRERLERGEKFRVLADQLGYPSADAARKAFYAAQSRLLLQLRKDGISGPNETR